MGQIMAAHCKNCPQARKLLYIYYQDSRKAANSKITSNNARMFTNVRCSVSEISGARNVLQKVHYYILLDITEPCRADKLSKYGTRYQKIQNTKCQTKVAAEMTLLRPGIDLLKEVLGLRYAQISNSPSPSTSIQTRLSYTLPKSQPTPNQINLFAFQKVIFVGYLNFCQQIQYTHMLQPCTWTKTYRWKIPCQCRIQRLNFYYRSKSECSTYAHRHQAKKYVNIFGSWL